MSENMKDRINKQNQKQIRKMKKYINTFPLEPTAIDLIYKDIEGMAEEAQEREEPLEKVLGKSTREFCDELMYAIGGIKTPGGRTILRFVGAYYQIWGCWALFSVIFSICVEFVMMFTEILGSTGNVESFLETLTSIVEFLIVGIVYYTAGKRAVRYSTDVSEAGLAMKWAIGMLVFELVYGVVFPFFTEGTTKNLAILLPLRLIISSWAPILYIIGARRNRPHEEGMA